MSHLTPYEEMMSVQLLIYSSSLLSSFIAISSVGEKPDQEILETVAELGAAPHHPESVVSLLCLHLMVSVICHVLLGMTQELVPRYCVPRFILSESLAQYPK